MNTTTLEATQAAAQGAKPKYQRRQYLIDPLMQGRFTLTLLLGAGVIVSGIVLLAGHYLSATLAAGGAVTNSEIQRELTRVAVVGFAAAVLTLPLLSILLSHRIAGPAWRLRKAAREVSAGKLDGHIHLRTHDYLKTTAEAFNAMVCELREQKTKTESTRAAAVILLQEAKQKLTTGDDFALPEALRLIEDAQNQLR